MGLALLLSLSASTDLALAGRHFEGSAWFQVRTAQTPGNMKGVLIGRLAGFVTWPEKAFKDKEQKVSVVFVGDDTDGVETGFRGEVIAKGNAPGRSSQAGATSPRSA